MTDSRQPAPPNWVRIDWWKFDEEYRRILERLGAACLEAQR